jgi:hypothetical protein
MTWRVASFSLPARASITRPPIPILLKHYPFVLVIAAFFSDCSRPFFLQALTTRVVVVLPRPPDSDLTAFGRAGVLAVPVRHTAKLDFVRLGLVFLVSLPPPDPRGFRRSSAKPTFGSAPGYPPPPPPSFVIRKSS